MFLRFRSFYSKAFTNAEKFVLEDGSTLYIKKKSEIIELPPRVRNYPKRDILSNEQINEIKQKRLSDPDTNTVLQLAKQYNTFPGFIMKITKCPNERRQYLTENAINEFNQLPPSKKKRAIDRLRRKELW